MSNGKNGNGLTLLERFIPDGLSHAATTFVDSLKINSISEKTRRGRRVVIKRRNGHSEQLADLANLYFRLSNIPIRFWSKVEDWKRWETECFQMLNGDRFRVYPSGANAHEFRRAHRFWSGEFGGPWSHGDATTTNVIYNQRTGRARLIDFEIIHDKSLPATARHADDLLVFLLDIVGTVPSQQWLPFALRFLNAYDNLDVIAELKNQLALPSGMAWIWWGVRTSFANPAKVKRRLEKLRGVITDLRHYRTVAAKRARKRRRASITCQEMSPGMPRASSRTRAIKESANAASPGIPSRLPMTT